MSIIAQAKLELAAIEIGNAARRLTQRGRRTVTPEEARDRWIMDQIHLGGILGQ